jgi:Calx-beta domain
VIHRRRVVAVLTLLTLLLPLNALIAAGPAAAVTPPTIAVGDASVYEGNSGLTIARVTVTLSDPQPTDLVVTFTSVDETAVAGSDYAGRHGRVRIRAGRTNAAITVKIVGDTTPETDEAFAVSLTGMTPSGIAISDATATITIRNDEPAPLPGVPTALAAAAGPIPRYLTATWSAPTTGAAADGYDLEVSRADTTNVLSDVTAPSTFGCGLASVTDSCTLRVRAFNGSGAGAWSDPVTASTWAPPAAPPNLRMLGGTAVEWDEPASDRPIEGYWVQKSVDDGLHWTAVTTTTDLRAVTTCSLCSVRVVAQSDVGFGEYSTIDIAFSPPSPPTALTVIRDTENPALLHISWEAPVLATPPVDEYIVTVNDLTAPIVLSGIRTTTVDVRLPAPSFVLVSAAARNAAGMSIPASITVPAA